MRLHNKNKLVKAYTLLEVVLAIVLGAALITASLRWATSIANVVVSSVGVSDSGNIPIAFSRLADDVTASTHCATNGFDPIIRELTPTALVLTSTSSNGTTQGVYYFIDSNSKSLLRGVSNFDANCNSTTPTSFQTLITDLDTTESYFAPITSGELSTEPGDYLTCASVLTPGCVTPAFALHFKRNGYVDQFEESFKISIK